MSRLFMNASTTHMNLARILACSAWLALGAAASANAEVKQAAADSFLIVQSARVAATPAKVYAALPRIGEWWNGDHSYSSDAANFSLAAEAGACFCERWSDGSVEHGRVIFAQRDKLLRLSTALGPLQGRAVTGILTFELKADANGTLIELTYRVNGASTSTLDKSAPAVDEVLGEQLARFARFVETGSAAPPAKR
jgi:uncharacterized protein YndB with AHSA1/START domain